MKLFTIGFTGTTAENFFARLLESGVRRVLDVRVHNTSQLSGFAKRDDLDFFLNSVGGITYRHCPELAPHEDMLSEYRQTGDWAAYEKSFLTLMKDRKIETIFNRSEMKDSCLLCSEKLPHHCHRKIVADYLAEKWGKIKVIHL